jgi:hypothetical protein
MFKKYGLAAILVIAGAAPAFADDTCQVPPVPAAIDGTSATADQMRASIAAFNAFSKASDTYQGCIADYITAQNAQADKDKKPHDATMIQAEGDKVTANQSAKEKAGTDLNAAIGVYKKAHPG